MNEQWKKAVINLECATDSEHSFDYDIRIKELKEEYNKGGMSLEEYRQKMNRNIRDIRVTGTAIFIIHNGNKYLLTARHVIFDELSANREYQEEVLRSEGQPPRMKKDSLDRARELSLHRIFRIIFRVPSFDEILSGEEFKSPSFLMNLNSGGHKLYRYSFSRPDLDLAIISLEQESKEFADELIALGYSPIPSELIKDEPSAEGVEVSSVGFPGETSLVAQINQDAASAKWSSSAVSLPVFSWGRVSMLHPMLPFYWCDIGLYPGNSGGPLIENGKLVGIVSSQATVPLDEAPQLRTRIPFARIIKAGFIKQLLEEREAKDRERYNIIHRFEK